MPGFRPEACCRRLVTYRAAGRRSNQVNQLFNGIWCTQQPRRRVRKTPGEQPTMSRELVGGPSSGNRPTARRRVGGSLEQGKPRRRPPSSDRGGRPGARPAKPIDRPEVARLQPGPKTAPSSSTTTSCAWTSAARHYVDRTRVRKTRDAERRFPAQRPDQQKPRAPTPRALRYQDEQEEEARGRPGHAAQGGARGQVNQPAS